MPNNNSKALVLFEDKPVRRVWSEKDDKWYFSIVDVVAILAESNNPTDYIKKMRSRDKELSKGWGQIVTPLTVSTKGGPQKMNCANAEGIFRIIQSIPSPKAEPFKKWLAKVGYERLQEIVSPEIAVNRARKNWLDMGHSEKWVEQRMRGQEIRNKLTDYWSGITIKQHKSLKEF